MTKIQTIYTGGSEVKKADSDMAYSLKVYILLVRDVWVMLTVNL